MSFMIGFGSTEIKVQDALEEKIRLKVSEFFKEESEVYFNDKLINRINDWLSAISNEAKAKSEEYKEAAIFPERYSYFYPTIINDASHIVFILKFNHINRRHALSPDGWAMMQTDKIFYIYILDETIRG